VTQAIIGIVERGARHRSAPPPTDEPSHAVARTAWWEGPC
jgi:hypothetical protein